MQIAPSILSADFARLADEVGVIGEVADWVHVDVMDNHFVPNLTFGLSMVEALLKNTALPLDCHLMIEDPDRWAPSYAEAGARSVTFHAEAAQAPVRLARGLRSLGVRGGAGLPRARGAGAGRARRRPSPMEPYLDLLEEFDLILIMTVEPGFGGQKFLEACLPKVRRTREAVDKAGLDVWVQVDGGVSETTIGRCAEAGADVFVAGSAVYSAQDAAAEISALRELAAQGVHR